MITIFLVFLVFTIIFIAVVLHFKASKKDRKSSHFIYLILGLISLRLIGSLFFGFISPLLVFDAMIFSIAIYWVIRKKKNGLLFGFGYHLLGLLLAISYVISLIVAANYSLILVQLNRDLLYYFGMSFINSSIIVLSWIAYRLKNDIA